MPAPVLQAQKRALADATKSRSNATLPSITHDAKRRKLDFASSPASRFRGVKGTQGSSQPKSQFEEEVLEKLTQDINGLKNKNAEKDQEWARPPLTDFNPDRDSLCFQQIETEEGHIQGGGTTIKLFGVTEVSL